MIIIEILGWIVVLCFVWWLSGFVAMLTLFGVVCLKDNDFPDGEDVGICAAFGVLGPIVLIIMLIRMIQMDRNKNEVTDNEKR